ncbi:MAG: 50S ribosomal protein L17, partial [Terracoccus sp.]
TRLTKIGARKGDRAPMVVIELVREPLSAKKATVKEAEGATKRAVKEADAAAAAEATATAETVESDAVEATEGSDAKEVPAGAVVANEDGTSPDESYTVKGNADSGKFHEPDGQWYGQTVAEFWFKNADDAETAGFTRAGADS